MPGVVQVGFAGFDGAQRELADQHGGGGLDGAGLGDLHAAREREGAAAAVVELESFRRFLDVGDGLGVFAAGFGEAAVGGPVGFGEGGREQGGGDGERGDVAKHGDPPGWGDCSVAGVVG